MFTTAATKQPETTAEACAVDYECPNMITTAATKQPETTAEACAVDYECPNSTISSSTSSSPRRPESIQMMRPSLVIVPPNSEDEDIKTTIAKFCESVSSNAAPVIVKAVDYINSILCSSDVTKTKKATLSFGDIMEFDEHSRTRREILDQYASRITEISKDMLDVLSIACKYTFEGIVLSMNSVGDIVVLQGKKMTLEHQKRSSVAAAAMKTTYISEGLSPVDLTDDRYSSRTIIG
eukprot:GHVH01005583.1.p1 GENE.GHVH01005583.1~~GHVH01005583.1.p1  ORF type:complete len:237 (-),score=36.20 GHVH01005583.1:129-839(-)